MAGGAMICDRIELPEGGFAIVCRAGRRQTCRACGRPATLLCDWKVKGGKGKTCSAPMCDRCAREVAPEKHLCKEHSRLWDVHPRNRPAEVDQTQLELLSASSAPSSPASSVQTFAQRLGCAFCRAFDPGRPSPLSEPCAVCREPVEVCLSCMDDDVRAGSWPAAIQESAHRAHQKVCSGEEPRP